MDRLVTKLETNLGSVLRGQLDDNFKKIQDGVDGQSDSLNKQIADLLGDVAPQDQNEVTQARIDSNGKSYKTLKGREDATQATAETALDEERLVSAEVQDARTDTNSKTYASIKERLDNQQNDLINNIDSKISQISSVPETFSTIVDLQNLYPNGKTGLFVVAETGHKYIWTNNSWVDAGIYQAVGIADGTIKYNNLDEQARTLESTFFDIRKSALSRMFYNYLPFIFEIGAINSSTGSNVDNPSSMVRSGFVYGDGQNWNFYDQNPDKYNYRLLSYKLDGTFNKLEFDWKSSDGATYLSDTSLKYRLTMTTKDQTEASLVEANQSVYAASDKDKAPYNPMDLWGSFDYMINVGGGEEPTIIVEPNKDITITLPDNYLYYYDNIQTGFTLQSKLEFQSKTFTLKTSQVLYWDLESNIISVSEVSQSRPKHNVLLANNIWGQITNGHFSQYVKDWGLFGYMINVAGNKQPTFENTGVNALTIKITMPASDLFYYDNTQTGFVLQSPANYEGSVFTLENNQLLVWNLDDNTIKVQKIGERRPNHNVLLANNIYGKITNGHFAQYFQMQNHDGYTNAKGHSLTATSQYKQLTHFSLGNIQSICFIGDDILTCQGAPGDHSTTSHIILYDENFNKIKDITHDIGHFNTVDYNETYDTLITGNASDDVENPKIYLIKNFSTINDGDTIHYNSNNVIEIDLFNSTNVAFDSNIGVCFGETDYIAYVSFVNVNTVKNLGQMGTVGFAKVMLGLGDNDLSGEIEGWGTFIDDQSGYNGTAKILQRFYGENIGANQDMTYFDGHLWGTFGRYDTQFHKVGLHSGGKFTLEESWALPNYDEKTGMFNQQESEGSAIWKGMYYLTVYKGAINAIPINRKQAGNGIVGTKVAFDFPGSQIPHVSITPTSSTTDLYIDSIDKNGFLVNSTTSQLGTFNWESNI